ncbi:CBS domain-containing protein [Halolactibacillus halophilus]|uniref:CBS domain-containing protein n=1 Tax=Halolactibacillus halophilus TaxID=306540 RepID=A0A1I5NBT2_9BACI|nr:CBS domain-containing protein [Halolactibacillus halophilus]GEM01140.1 hypothetical protein HHA03_06720 [Halolactibacillus halophilus]SFP19204.1 CBS domain-containing protein [Halolactibacillus halophilus]
MRNDERFIVAFNKIEKYLDQQIHDTRYVPFHRAVQRLRKSNPIVSHYQQDLLEFSQLRNAIVHERTGHEYTIADPHNDIVELIEKIEQELTAPETVINLFGKTLRTIQADLTVEEVLNIIKETTFSQFPVYVSKQFIGLLTDKCILHFIAQSMNGDSRKLFNTEVRDLLKEDAVKEANYRFVASEMSIFEAEAIFMEAMKKDKVIDALLITDSGESYDKLKGLISPTDLIKIE